MGLDVGDSDFGDVFRVERWPGPRPAMAGRIIPAPGGYQTPYNTTYYREGFSDFNSGFKDVWLFNSADKHGDVNFWN